MERLEHDWTVHPVIYLDMSSDKYADVANLHSVINHLLSKYERLYNVLVNDSDTYGVRLGSIIEAAHLATGQLAVVLIDEYDAPLLDSTAASTAHSRRRRHTCVLSCSRASPSSHS